MKDIIIGIIGGSGLYKLDGFDVEKEIEICTPFGPTSDKILILKYNDHRIAFLPRHGRHHSILPTELNNKANIYAMKTLGVKKLISLSAVGSLKEEIKPGDFVIPDQLFDRTKLRENTFFGNGIVAHVAFADPYCNLLSDNIYAHANKLDIKTHLGGTYICIEGPQFSTKAESNFYRTLNADIIGMTNLQEAKLAREAEMCFSTVALVTDYDVWKDEEVTVDMVLKTMKKNSINAKKLLSYVLKDEDFYRIEDHSCYHSLDNAIMTDLSTVPHDVYRKYSLFLEEKKK